MSLWVFQNIGKTMACREKWFVWNVFEQLLQKTIKYLIFKKAISLKKSIRINKTVRVFFGFLELKEHAKDRLYSCNCFNQILFV